MAELREKLKLKADQVDQLIRDHKTAFEAQENVIAELRKAAPRRTPELTERVAKLLEGVGPLTQEAAAGVADLVFDEIFGKDPTDG